MGKTAGKILTAVGLAIAGAADRAPVHAQFWVALIGACLAAAGGALGWTARADAAELKALHAQREAEKPLSQRRIP